MKALLLVDLQKDFMPGGALAVSEGDEVVPVANRLSSSLNFDIMVITQDWHPPGHKSFASNNDGAEVGQLGELGGKPQVWWPDHCVWNTPGSELHGNLLTGRANLIIRKGMDKEVDSYSGFFDNDGSPVGLGDYLKERGVTDVYIMGLATDYCVKFTALDCAELGFNTHLVEDGCRAVNINPDDGANAIKEMKEAGIKVVHSDTLTKRS